MHRRLRARMRAHSPCSPARSPFPARGARGASCGRTSPRRRRARASGSALGAFDAGRRPRAGQATGGPLRTAGEVGAVTSSRPGVLAGGALRAPSATARVVPAGRAVRSRRSCGGCEVRWADRRSRWQGAARRAARAAARRTSDGRVTRGRPAPIHPRRAQGAPGGRAPRRPFLLYLRRRGRRSLPSRRRPITVGRGADYASRSAGTAEVSRLHAQLERVGARLGARRRRALAQRLVRQRRARGRAPAPARRRPARASARPPTVPRAPASAGVALHDRRHHRPGAPSTLTAHAAADPRRAVPAAGGLGLRHARAPTSEIAEEISPQRRRRQGAPADALRALRARGPAAEPEARAAGRGGAGRRAWCASRLLITLRGGGQGRVHDARGGRPRGPALQPGQGLLPEAGLDEARPRRVLPGAGRRRASTCASARR